jgi:hypothetical protein
MRPAEQQKSVAPNQTGGRAIKKAKEPRRKKRQCHHGRRIKTRDSLRQQKPARDPTGGHQSQLKNPSRHPNIESPCPTSKGATSKDQKQQRQRVGVNVDIGGAVIRI